MLCSLTRWRSWKGPSCRRRRSWLRSRGIRSTLTATSPTRSSWRACGRAWRHWHMPSATTELPTLMFATPRALETWLAKNHGQSTGVWLRFAKKGSSQTSVTYAEALEVALCYGWIDGQKAKGDDETWLQKFTPRSKRSIWSKINRDKALALIEAGRMKPSGLREIERAKEDGRWAAAYDGQRTATVPDDLAEALAKNAKARKHFETLNSVNRYAILFRIANAKTPETRAGRIKQFVDMLARGEVLHP